MRTRTLQVDLRVANLEGHVATAVGKLLQPHAETRQRHREGLAALADGRRRWRLRRRRARALCQQRDGEQVQAELALDGVPGGLLASVTPGSSQTTGRHRDDGYAVAELDRHESGQAQGRLPLTRRHRRPLDAATERHVVDTLALQGHNDSGLLGGVCEVLHNEAEAAAPALGCGEPAREGDLRAVGHGKEVGRIVAGSLHAGLE
mmetsp:Transcript_94781/g.267581  ORF Transcript_94781/g.267581 Transcript_94781/m.267581 type:complete len:205 (-) Transcript_94781:205-819(-)